jgi:uncharacterized protein YbjT (DUF2867 family)
MSMTPTALRVLVAGATGLVGSRCVARLRDDARVAQVIALQRREAESDAKVRVARIDFERIDSLNAAGFVADAAICALGSTIRQAGSRAAFRRIDHDYVLGFARLAQRSGVKRFGLVSALGADPASRVFYNRVKGEVEQAVEALGFASLTIAQPSLLLGDRTEVRFGETFLAPFARHLPRRWRAVPADAVARAVVTAVLRAKDGVWRLDNAELLTHAD